jgi:6-pyruvoyltetrahydropterin/6-carboxytetrahydropterin synthase
MAMYLDNRYTAAFLLMSVQYTMKLYCTRRITFCMGHRLLNHEGHCVNLHGHNYVLEIYAEAEQLDSLGRVIDFAVLKEKVGGWIDTNWDHGFTRAQEDELAAEALRITNSKEFILPYNPTAENLAHYLLFEVCPQVLAGTGVTVKKIKLWETENCSVECML